ncbi:MAG: hypothetical protein F2789_12910, partial [Actinobacteria bacterium]|nr:hypothetical protein [Actinomycetota bacterium]
MHSLTPDVVRSLQMADTDERLAALERFAVATFPTAHEEIWRYSRIGELNLDAYRLGTLTTTITGADSIPSHDAADVTGTVLDLFEDLNRAFMSPICLRIPAGVVHPEPIVITHTLLTD